MNRKDDDNRKVQNKKKKKGFFGRKDKVETRESKKDNIKENISNRSDEAWDLPIKPKRQRVSSNTNANRPNPNRQAQARPNPNRPNSGRSSNVDGNGLHKNAINNFNNESRGNSGQEHRSSVNRPNNKAQQDGVRRKRKDESEQNNYKRLRVYNQADLVAKQTNNKDARRTQFYIGLTAFIILLYFGSNIYRMLANDSIDDMQLEKTIVDTPKVYDGIILRNEVLTKASTDGELEYKVANNEKAKVNQLVAQVVTGDEVVQSIEISSEEFTAANKVLNTDIENINSRIKAEFSYSKIQDFSQAYVYAEKIYESMEVRNQMILSEMSASTKTVDKSTVKESLYTAVSGIVSYDLDTYEEKYILENIDEITADNVKEVAKASTTVRSKLVEKDEVAFKVLTENTWYIVAFIDNEEIKSRGIEANSNYKLYANKANVFIPVMSKIESIAQGEKTSKVVFKCDSYTSDYADKRSITFKLAKDNIEGFKVPKTAIKQKESVVINNDYIFFNEENGYDYVIKKGYNGETYEVPIVKYKTENVNTYVLKSDTELNKGDMLIKDGEMYQIPDIYIINGVYLLNTGVVTFKEVTIYNGQLGDENVVFLEANMNKNVRIHDTIAVNVAEISEDEIIY